MTRPLRSPGVRVAAAALVVACTLAAAARPVAGQGRLVGTRTVSGGPVYETWSFGDGVPQPTIDNTTTARVTGASQWSVPVAVVVPFGARWKFDLSGAYASGQVTLDGNDPALDTDGYALSGPTDMKLRVTGPLAGENLLVTLGVNAPTGKTGLDDEELSALRVLAAPALAFPTPALGTGFGGTTGLVFARQMGGWAWALGASYEFRGKYNPIAALQAGAGNTDLNPGDGVHLSLGGDGLLGSNGMTLALGADFFTADEFTFGGQAQSRRTVRLGPVYSAEWQLRLAAARARELTVYAVDRYRSKFTQDGAAVAGSSGNYLDAGLRAVWAASPSLGILTAVNARHHTGLSVDNSLVTAAVASGGATLGLVVGTGGATVQPFVRVQAGQLDTGGDKTSITGFGGGVSLGASF